jgi:hypothetical protein
MGNKISHIVYEQDAQNKKKKKKKKEGRKEGRKEEM